MEIDETINNWFEKTFRQIQTDVRPPTPLDICITQVLLCAKRHANATLMLLRNSYILPSTVLLRVLLELYAKFYWCMHLPCRTNSDLNTRIYTRFKRWDYSRTEEHRKLLRNLQHPNSGYSASEIGKALEKANQAITIYQNQGLKPMPNVAAIFKEMSGDWQKHVYPKIYQDFTAAIHSDQRIIRQFVKVQNKQIVCFSDIDEEPKKLLKYCASMACDINLKVRRHYAWDVEQIQNEFESLTR